MKKFLLLVALVLSFAFDVGAHDDTETSTTTPPSRTSTPKSMSANLKMS